MGLAPSSRDNKAPAATGVRYDSIPTLGDAIALATKAHRGQSYPSPEPEPYILHPLRVMRHVSRGDAQIVAVLHDVVEDTDVTLELLREIGFCDRIVTALDLLTRRPGETYEDYIHRLGDDPLAREVKFADIGDNLANNRELPHTSDNMARIARYEWALDVLK